MIYDGTLSLTVEVGPYAQCDSCNTHFNGVRSNEGPEQLIANKLDPLKFYGHQVYAMAGRIPKHELLRQIVQAGWSATTFGNKLFTFCPKCKRQGEGVEYDFTRGEK